MTPTKVSETLTYTASAGALYAGFTENQWAAIFGVIGVIVGIVFQGYTVYRQDKAMAAEALRRQREETLLQRDEERKQREEERKQREEERREAVYQRRLKMTDAEFYADAGASSFEMPTFPTKRTR
jgi:hypothetical protein